jgi:hypothetical protein
MENNEMARPRKEVPETIPTVAPAESVAEISIKAATVKEVAEEVIQEDVQGATTPSSPYYFRIPLQDNYAILAEQPDDFYNLKIFLEWDSTNIFFVCKIVAKKAVMAQFQVWLQLVNRANSLTML